MRSLLRPGIVAAVAALFVLTSCAPEPDTTATPPASSAEDGSAKHESAEPTSTPEPAAQEPAEAEPRTQAETCDWDSPQLTAGATPPAAGARDGSLASVLVGSWQHTHFDTGAGYEALDNDIRFVFPSADRILYCQHVPGITDHAENAADFVLNDRSIDLPGGAPGYEVAEWSDDAMVWINRLDNSKYLLQRR